MSAAATTHRIATLPSIFMPPAIRSSKATILRKVGLGVTSTRSLLICPSVSRLSSVRSHVITELIFTPKNALSGATLSCGVLLPPRGVAYRDCDRRRLGFAHDEQNPAICE